MLFLPSNRGSQNFRVIKFSLLFIAMFHRCRRRSRGRREMISIDGIVILYYIEQLFFLTISTWRSTGTTIPRHK